MIREKRRKKRIIMTIVKVVSTVAAVSAALFAVVYFGFHIRKVTVEGNTLYTDEYIKEIAVTEDCRDNSLVLLALNLLHPVKEPEFVESMNIGLSSPGRVVITIKEKEFAGVVGFGGAISSDASGDAAKRILSDSSGDASGNASGDVMSSGDASLPVARSYVYFDSEGVVTEISDRLLDDLLYITAVFRQEPQLNEKLSLKGAGSLDYLKEALYYLGYYGLVPDHIQISERAALTAYFGDVSVYFGKNTHTSEKIERLSKILPGVRNKKGSVDMSGWSDADDDIIFKET